MMNLRPTIDYHRAAAVSSTASRQPQVLVSEYILPFSNQQLLSLGDLLVKQINN